MGTRGTLRVYLDGKLKVRQYNQWDSYPTGQFMGICDFISSVNNRHELVSVLKRLAFYKKEEMEEFRDENGDVNVFEQAKYLYTTNRDWGYKILWLLCIMPSGVYTDRKTAEGGQVSFLLADWADVFGEEDLSPQEGNYTIELYSDRDDFLLSGDWHGVKRAYRNETPDTDEVEEWEAEGNEA